MTDQLLNQVTAFYCFSLVFIAIAVFDVLGCNQPDPISDQPQQPQEGK